MLQTGIRFPGFELQRQRRRGFPLPAGMEGHLGAAVHLALDAQKGTPKILFDVADGRDLDVSKVGRPIPLRNEGNRDNGAESKLKFDSVELAQP